MCMYARDIRLRYVCEITSYVYNKLRSFKIFPSLSLSLFFNVKLSKRGLHSTIMWKRVIVASVNTERQLQLSRDRLISLP